MVNLKEFECVIKNNEIYVLLVNRWSCLKSARFPINPCHDQ